MVKILILTGATSEGPLGCLSYYLDVELENVILRELISMYVTDPMRRNEPGD